MMYVQYLQDMWQSLISAWWVKSALSVVAAVAIWLIGLKHVQVLGIFYLIGWQVRTLLQSILFGFILDLQSF